jgi:mannose-6-phosphate isomerase-like protein (cupin superfamily)
VRRVLAGIDSDGRSAVVDEREIPRPNGTRTAHALHKVRSCPPPARPYGRGIDHPAGVAAGHVLWGLVHWPPGSVGLDTHHTDTIDFGLVVDGSIELVLDDGRHQLSQGDCIVVQGVDHSWRAGPAGCTLSVLSLGTPPPESGTERDRDE